MFPKSLMIQTKETKQVKKILVLAAVIFGISRSVNASSTATLFLEGYIETIIGLVINPVIGSANTLNIVSGEAGRNIASATETFNGTNGYTITMESVRAGFLRHNNATSQVAYQISYDGGAATTPGAVGSGALVKSAAPSAVAVTDISVITINVTAGGATLPAGAYTDTLIFTISAL